jgi:hypothetical protein
MQLNYCSGVGELIWAMTTCCLNLAFASVKLLQSNPCPHELHCHALKNALKFQYASGDDGPYIWCTCPQLELPEGPLPLVCSNKQDILLENLPHFDANIAHDYYDSDWATWVKTRTSFSASEFASPVAQ